MLAIIIIQTALLTAIGIFAYTLYYKWKQAELKRFESIKEFNTLEARVNNLQLENLESKLNPHLFKNVLNSIQSHAYQTYFALDKLANVLDYILYESKNRFVSPREEIEFAINLIDIHKIKISPLFELKVKTKVDEQDALYNEALLAPLICIDPIENAFKHADLQSSDAFISIHFEFQQGLLKLSVSNKVSEKMPLKKDKSGIGADSLEKRLRIIYGEHYKLERFKEGDVFVTQLKINLLEYRTQMYPTR